MNRYFTYNYEKQGDLFGKSHFFAYFCPKFSCI